MEAMSSKTIRVKKRKMEIRKPQNKTHSSFRPLNVSKKDVPSSESVVYFPIKLLLKWTC